MMPTMPSKHVTQHPLAKKCQGGYNSEQLPLFDKFGLQVPVPEASSSSSCSHVPKATREASVSKVLKRAIKPIMCFYPVTVSLCNPTSWEAPAASQELGLLSHVSRDCHKSGARPYLYAFQWPSMAEAPRHTFCLVHRAPHSCMRDCRQHGDNGATATDCRAGASPASGALVGQPYALLARRST